MENQLTDLQKAKIEAFVKDQEMYEAVKTVLFAVIYSDGVVSKGKQLNQRNGAFSLIANSYAEGKNITNDELGAQLRAKFEGVHCILDGFDKLKTIKSKSVKVDDLIANEAI